MTTLLIGGGLLGSSVAACSSSPVHRLAGVPWGNEAQAIRTLTEAVGDLVSRDEHWRLVWTAGAGVVGSRSEGLAQETRYLQAALDTITASARSQGRVFLAGSAGGVHGAGDSAYIDESTPPVPISDYGRWKLTQEQLAVGWAADTGHSLLVGRLTNLYGPRQRLEKPQGLISQALLRCLHHVPLQLTVPEETQRDFLHADDAALRICSWLDDPAPCPPMVKIIGSGRPVTLAHLFGVLRSVTRVGVRMVRRPSDVSKLQPSHLRFRSTVLTDLDRLPTRALVVGVRQTWDALLVAHGHGGHQEVPLPSR